MADRNLNDLLLQEYRRLWPQSRTTSGADDRLLSSALSAGQVNKGYTQPAPQPSPQPSHSTTAGDIGRTALKIFTTGFGLAPLISGLANLFGGGSSAPPPLSPYAMPRAIRISAATPSPGGAFRMAGYSQSGAPRAYDDPAGIDPGLGEGAAPLSPVETSADTAGAAPGINPQRDAAPAPAPAPQIVVNVQALDSQSFLDRSPDIARAVREAMLNMHAINDVVSEL